MPTCGQASSMRAMPENEIPPAPPGDHYSHDELYYQVQQRIEEKEEVHMNLW